LPRGPRCPIIWDDMSPKIAACFFGWSDTGKTTFIERLIGVLVERGLPCAALKVAKHPGGFMLPGKDSTRFFQAGAETALVGGPETVLALRSPETLDRAFLDRLFPDARVVLIEGGQIEGALRVLTAGAAVSEAELKLPLKDVDALITGSPELSARAAEAGVRSLTPDDIDRFIELLEECMEQEVTVTCGGKNVPMNPFVMGLVRDVSLAVINSLKKVEAGEEIVIRIAAPK